MFQVGNGIEVEITARRCLSYLSGGQIVALLQDILYEEEKERIADRHRRAILRLGEVVKHFKPQLKGNILNAMRQSGFSKEDLRERGWSFSTHLWNSSGYNATQSFKTLPPVRKSKRHVMTTKTSFSRRTKRSFLLLLFFFQNRHSQLVLI